MMFQVWRGVFRVVDGIFNRGLRYLFATLILVTLFSLGIYGLELFLVVLLRFDTTQTIWDELAIRTGTTTQLVKLIAYGLAQANFLLIFHRSVSSIAHHFHLSLADWLDELHLPDSERDTESQHRQASLKAVGASVLIGTALLPLCLQPTLIEEDDTQQPNAQRLSNLLGGAAITHLPHMAKTLHRQHLAPSFPALHRGVSAQEFDQVMLLSLQEDKQLMKPSMPSTIKPSQGSTRPLIDRWDPLIWEAAQMDARRFAQIKSVMWIESAGRQFAISRTGCAGLMQFCSGTARRRPFEAIFGVGQVSSCGCSRSSCYVSQKTRREMEMGKQEVLSRWASRYPCDLSDARFDANKSILAGARYIQNLDEEFGGNLALIYIGYNSGPMVAREVWRATGYNPEVTLVEISRVLKTALRPHYGSSARRRASSLTRRHLPKLLRTFAHYSKTQKAPALPKLFVDRGNTTPELGQVGSKVSFVASHDVGQSVCVGPEEHMKPNTTRPIPLMFLKGLALNLKKGAILSQEGDGESKDSYRVLRWRDKSQALHQEALTSEHANYARVNVLAYENRAVFGLRASHYLYTMNPNHGRYDMLEVSLESLEGAPNRFAHFQELRDNIAKTLGAATTQEVLVRQGSRQGQKKVHKGDFDGNKRAPMRVARALWRTPEVSVALTTRGDGQDVAHLVVWTASAESHWAATQTQWARFASTKMPQKLEIKAPQKLEARERVVVAKRTPKRAVAPAPRPKPPETKKLKQLKRLFAKRRATKPPRRLGGKQPQVVLPPSKEEEHLRKLQEFFDNSAVESRGAITVNPW